jgi:hypothetical protein
MACPRVVSGEAVLRAAIGGVLANGPSRRLMAAIAVWKRVSQSPLISTNGRWMGDERGAATLAEFFAPMRQSRADRSHSTVHRCSTQQVEIVARCKQARGSRIHLAQPPKQTSAQMVGRGDGVGIADQHAVGLEREGISSLAACRARAMRGVIRFAATPFAGSR